MGGRATSHDYDLIVIGSGAGGGVGAHIAKGLGKKVAIIEKERLGGECPNFGCVPTKALLQAAEVYDTAKNAGQFGVRVGNVSLNLPAIKKWKDLAVFRTGASEGAEAFSADGIDVIKGHAQFISPHEVSVGGRRYTARKFLVATGTRNFIPPIPGLGQAGYITYREAIDLTKPIGSIFVIGGGAIGCEFADLFNTLGSKVYQAEFSPQLAGREDAEVGELMKAVFEARGMHVFVGAEVFNVEVKNGKKVVHFRKGKLEQYAIVDEILVATGKVPNTDLGLENAGVKFDRHGITVNERMQTSAKHIYAAGDVAGPFAFTHTASYQSRIAAHNMFHNTKVVAKYHAVPRCIFTTPEVASVGLSEADARAQGLKLKIGAVPISIIGRANTTNQDTGFVKVIATHRGVLVGASIVAPRAGEMIHELALAVNLGLKAEDVAATIHAFPTWSEAVRIACAQIS